ncbi:hypothetical protein EXU48_12445 [Occultella glacieicola]|uniref:DUF1700 domain-containing protein n=1 Tax=Occultella glacieicola TaxID=2518684 RepID=A0ABY2E7E5_9MICO|nr:permease prefix domain 1-containing protein [Occultella glacieicola]TDE94236.1 hypothetical protein EXU48_12445 [Occultella glacieicola]
MDAITTYVDHIFRSLPPTAEVARARSELLQMSEDRYRELLAEGVSEHEAVGRVITQFGNLDELADDLGIRSELDRAGRPDAPIDLSHGEAERYLAVRRRGAWLVSGGVLVILLGIAQLVLFSDGAGSDPHPLSLVAFFVAIAGAVAGFIVAGASMSRYDRLKDKELRLEPQVAAAYREQREREQTSFVVKIAAGVAVIILSVAIPATLDTMYPDSEPVTNLAVAAMLVAIGLAVALLIEAGLRRGALDRLTAEGDYAPEKRASNSLTGRIAGPYWIVAAAVFLAWSFIGNAWDRSWLVWPVAGVLFAAVAVGIESFTPKERSDGGR